MSRRKSHDRATRSPSFRIARRGIHWFALLGLIGCPLNHPMRSTEPTGFGKINFGATVSDFLGCFPAAKRRTGATPSQSGTQIDVTVYRIERQKIGPLNDCVVDLRFFGSPAALVDVRFACPARGKVLSYLIDEFGSPTNSTPEMVTWGGRHTMINYSPKTGAFDYGDRDRALAMQLAVIKAKTGKIGNELPQ